MISRMPEYVFIDDSTIQETRIDNSIRSEFESGPNSVRPRSNKTKYNVSFLIRIHEDDYVNFLDWFERVLFQGTHYFLMKDPLRMKDFRFRFLEGDLEFTKNNEILETTIALERWA